MFGWTAAWILKMQHLTVHDNNMARVQNSCLSIECIASITQSDNPVIGVLRSIVRLRVQIPTSDWLEISRPLAPLRQLGCNEYTFRTLLRRWGRGMTMLVYMPRLRKIRLLASTFTTLSSTALPPKAAPSQHFQGLLFYLKPDTWSISACYYERNCVTVLWPPTAVSCKLLLWMKF